MSALKRDDSMVCYQSCFRISSLPAMDRTVWTGGRSGSIKLYSKPSAQIDHPTYPATKHATFRTWKAAAEFLAAIESAFSAQVSQ